MRHWILEDKKLHAAGLTSLELTQGTDSDAETHDHDAQQPTQISTPAAVKTASLQGCCQPRPTISSNSAIHSHLSTHAECICKACLLACLPGVCCLVMACVVIPSSPSFSASSTTSSAIFLWLFLRLPSTFNLAWFIWLSASDSSAQLLKGDFMAVGCIPCAPMPGMATPPGSEEPSCATLVSPTSARQ